MKYVWIGLAILVVILLIIYFIRRKRAIRKVRSTCVTEKLCRVNSILEPFGFAFDLGDGIVISRNDGWQRDLGYTDLYDIKAPFLNMVMDAEPIYFDYCGKHYRLELWKGQYGITTGAEMGLYIKDESSPFSRKYYRSARDDERIKMGFILFKECKLFSRCHISWWLTGFDVGVFSRPKDLGMKIFVELFDEEMTASFVNGLLCAGYDPNDIEVDCNCVYFCFGKPKNFKLNHWFKIVKFIVQIFNRINCSLYMFFTRMFNKSLDKIAYITYMFPHLSKFIIRLCIPRRKHKKCRKNHKK